MNFSVEATIRKTGENEKIKTEGKIPAVVYGSDIKPMSIGVDAPEFNKLYNEAGSALINLTVEGQGEPLLVLIQAVQYNPVTRKIIHADFRQISMNKEITVDLDVNFVGESLAVKELGGTLNKGLETLSVKCLPKNLVQHIDVDVSILKNFDDVISVADLKLPEGIEVLDNADTLIAKVSAPLTEEQFEAMEKSGPASIEEIKVEEKEKKEEDTEGEEKSEEKK